MRAWLMGHFKMVTNTNWEGDIDIDLEVEPVEGRSADDMEVVKLQLIEVAQ
jgi:hypothetical protein